MRGRGEGNQTGGKSRTKTGSEHETPQDDKNYKIKQETTELKRDSKPKP